MVFHQISIVWLDLDHSKLLFFSCFGHQPSLRIMSGSAFTTAARDLTFPWQRASAKLGNGTGGGWKRGWKTTMAKWENPWENYGNPQIYRTFSQKKDVFDAFQFFPAQPMIVWSLERCCKEEHLVWTLCFQNFPDVSSNRAPVGARRPACGPSRLGNPRPLCTAVDYWPDRVNATRLPSSLTNRAAFSARCHAEVVQSWAFHDLYLSLDFVLCLCDRMIIWFVPEVFWAELLLVFSAHLAGLHW